MIKFRWANVNDVEPLLQLIEDGFAVLSADRVDKQEGWEHRVLFSYLYSKSDWDPNWVYLAETDGKIVAAVGFFPQTLWFEEIKIPVWAVSPVVCHPDYRGQGITGQAIIQALNELKTRDITAVFLWGLSKFYPRFGFVPLLPRYKTKISWTMLDKSPIEIGSDKIMRPFEMADLQGITKLYHGGNSWLWLQAERETTWWTDRVMEMGIELGVMREVPFAEKDNLLVWANKEGEVYGYLYFFHQSKQRRTIIYESGVKDREQARAFLVEFIKQKLPSDFELYIQGTPEHFLNAATYELGGTHLHPVPRGGMVKILDWINFLQALRPLLALRLQKAGLVIQGYELTIRINDLCLDIRGQNDGLSIGVNEIEFIDVLDTNRRLTNLVFGLYQDVDLQGMGERERIKMLFPMKYPFIWDANYLY